MSIETNPPVIPGFSSLTPVSFGRVFTIWRARQDSLGRDVYVKTFPEEASPAAVAHAIRMAKRLSAFSVDGLERIITIEEKTPFPYLVSEALSSKTLADLVEETGVLTENAILGIAGRIVDVLVSITSKEPIVLRSLKPQNLYVDGNGNVTVEDSSLAIVAGDPVDGPSVDGENIVGTPQYFSPEQAAGDPSIDIRADMYALGLVLYFLATRKTPFDGHDIYEVIGLQGKGNLEDPRAINKDVSDGFARFIARLTMKKKEDRYADWKQVREDIDRLQADSATISKASGEALSTIALTVPDRPKESSASNAKAKRHQPKSIKNLPDKNPRLGTTSESPYGREAPAKASAGSRHEGVKAFLWLLLLVWLGWLANCRMGNPLRLPAPYAPEIVIPALDSFFAALPESETQAVASPSTVSSRERGAEPVPVPRTSPAKATPPPAREPSVTPRVPVVPAPVTVERGASLRSEWFESVVNPLRAGDLDAAKSAATAAGNSEAGRIASLLASLPSADDVFVSALLRHKDEVITIKYMGKERKITPVRRDGGSLVTRFQAADGTEKLIPIQLSKISFEEKRDWMQDVDTEAEHAAVAIAALKAEDRFTASLHAKRAGALAPFLTAALK